MKRVFADSLYWIALSHERDQWHAAAVQVSQAIRGTEIVTTDEVLSEFLTALRHNASLRNTAALQVKSVFSDSSIIVLPQYRQTFDRGFAFSQARPDKQYSLTDCITKGSKKGTQERNRIFIESSFSKGYSNKRAIGEVGRLSSRRLEREDALPMPQMTRSSRLQGRR